MTKLKLGLIQTKVSEDIDKNLEKTAKLIKEAANKGAEIVCLQELFATQYFAQEENKKNFELAEEIPGKITNFLTECAKENKITLVAGSLYEKDKEKYYNTTLVFNANGKITAKYRKIHIPQDEKYFEQYYFSAGNLGFVQVKTNNTTIAPLICYDQWFPEAARVNTLKGAEILFYPTAIGWFDDLKIGEPFSAKRWENVMCGHASMNGNYVAAVNRVGKEGDLDFWGGSFIADPYGQVIARASSNKEEVLIAEINLNVIKESREGWLFLKNRKPQFYDELVK
jgi:predicted amidohydrolase